jgi:hypothetical protein
MWSRRASGQITGTTMISVTIYHLDAIVIRSTEVEVQLWILGTPQEYLYRKLGW